MECDTRTGGVFFVASEKERGKPKITTVNRCKRVRTFDEAIITQKRIFNDAFRLHTTATRTESEQPNRMAHGTGRQAGRNVCMKKMDNDVTEVPDIMQWMTANILTMEACRAERPESNQIFDSVMCVSSPSGQGACSGDSGGPLVYNGEVHGVASFVRFPCGTEISDVYERVFAHRSWIASVTV
uniref:Uncharacterized protein n=1 Tax=Anopheles albimanus TaxID=7167 RepID=A0A182F9G1_ANOAL